MAGWRLAIATAWRPLIRNPGGRASRLDTGKTCGTSGVGVGNPFDGSKPCSPVLFTESPPAGAAGVVAAEADEVSTSVSASPARARLMHRLTRRAATDRRPASRTPGARSRARLPRRFRVHARHRRRAYLPPRSAE